MLTVRILTNKTIKNKGTDAMKFTNNGLYEIFILINLMQKNI